MHTNEKDNIETLIGGNIKAYRNARGISGREFGEILGSKVGKEGKAWATSAVYMMEAGDRSFVIAELVAIAKILDVTLNDLVGSYYFPTETKPFKGGPLAIAKLSSIVDDLNKIIGETND